MVVFVEVEKKDVDGLKREGFVEEELRSVYELIRLRKEGVVLILYNSGKLLLQGKSKEKETLAKELVKRGFKGTFKEEVFRKETGAVIGSDESLKGDTFGGLVVAGVKADDKLREKLIELGVADSKKLSDKEILSMAEKIKKIVPCEIKSLLPEEYNHNGKVTKMLNKLHKQCADFLQPGKHVIDLYPGCTVGDVQETKAESKFVEVAAASVLARSAGLKQLNYLSKIVGFELPKGSTHVQEALQRLKEKKVNFKKFVKVDFNNVKKFL